MSSENSVSLHETEPNDISLNDSHMMGMNNIKCEVQQYGNINHNQPQHIPQMGYPSYEYMHENGNNFNAFPNFNPDSRMQYYNSYNLLQNFGQNIPIPYLNNTMIPQNMVNPNMNVESQLINNDMNSSKASSELNSSYNRGTKVEKDERYKIRRSKNNQAAKKCRDKKKSEIDRMYEEKKRLENNNKSLEHLIMNKDSELLQMSNEIKMKSLELIEKENIIHQLKQKLAFYESHYHASNMNNNNQ